MISFVLLAQGFSRTVESNLDRGQVDHGDVDSADTESISRNPKQRHQKQVLRRYPHLVTHVIAVLATPRASAPNQPTKPPRDAHETPPGTIPTPDTQPSNLNHSN